MTPDAGTPSPVSSISAPPSPSPSQSVQSLPGLPSHQLSDYLAVPGPQIPQSASAPSSPALGLINDGYKPIDYDEPSLPGLTPENFYGSLLCANGKPSPVLERMAHALYDWTILNSDESMQHAGFIEPAQYGWMLRKQGVNESFIGILLANIQSYYAAGDIPYAFHTVSSGQSVPCLDPRAWLHLVVFDVKVDPDKAHKFWDGVLVHFDLHDPLTREPFPKPLPRTAFPAHADSAAHDAYDKWHHKLSRRLEGPAREAQRAQMQQALGAMYGQLGLADPMAAYQSPFGVGMGAMGVGMGMGMGCNPAVAATMGNPAAMMGSPAAMMMGYPGAGMGMGMGIGGMGAGGMWNRGGAGMSMGMGMGMGMGPMQGQGQLQAPQQQQQQQQQQQSSNRDLGGGSGGGSDSGGTFAAVLNVVSAGLGFAAAEVGGGGNGDGNGGGDNNSPGGNWTVNVGGPGFNDGFGNGFGNGFGPGPAYGPGNGFGNNAFGGYGGFGNTGF